MVTQLRPQRGGFHRPFGCGWFIREFLAGRGPNGSPDIDPDRGAPQTDIFSAYKETLIRARAEGMVAREEEKRIRRNQRPFSIEEAEALTQALVRKMPQRSTGMTYHSFTNYFTILKRLGWVEETGETEISALQEHYPEGPPRTFYKITAAGIAATDEQLSDPIGHLYGYSRSERSGKGKEATS